MLPCRSALSDLGLIVDLKKNTLKVVLFCLKSMVFDHKSPKSVVFNFSACHTPQKKIYWNNFKKRLICLMLELGFGNKSDFDLKIESSGPLLV